MDLSESESGSVGNVDQVLERDNAYKPKTFNIWSLGIAIVIGGQYFAWNVGLKAGFGSFALATFLIGTAYLSLILSVAEVSSALPFAGGAYGLARCTLGFYAGFIIGCCETLEYIFYVSATCIALSTMICDTFSLSYSFKPLFWILFYGSSLAIQSWKAVIFWRFVDVIAIISTAILLIYCLGSLKWVNLARYGGYDNEKNPWFVGGMQGFMEVLILPAWFYVGVESLPFASNVVENPKTTIPRGSIYCMVTLFLTSILTLFVCSSLPPDISDTQASSIPFYSGFHLMGGMNMAAATGLCLPATYATAFGFIFPYGQILEALAESQLLPSFLKKKNVYGAPYVAKLFGSAISFGVCLLVNYFEIVSKLLFSLCILCGFLSYISQCIGYLFVRTKYDSLKREFKSPLGVFGACYGIIVFSFGAIAVIAFNEDHQIVLVTLAVIVLLLSVYYFVYAKSRQTFSAAEQKVLFVAHVINYNVGGAKKKPRSNRSSAKSNSKVHAHDDKSSTGSHEVKSISGKSASDYIVVGSDYGGDIEKSNVYVVGNSYNDVESVMEEV